MNKKEVYIALQAEWVRLNNVKVGTKVRVFRPNDNGEFGSDACNHSQGEIDRMSTDLPTVKRIVSDKVWIDHGAIYDWAMPFTCLEVVPDNEIYVRYFCEGKDVTNELSEESKKNLRKQ